MVLVVTPLLVASCGHVVHSARADVDMISAPERAPAWARTCAAALEDARKLVASHVAGAPEALPIEIYERPHDLPADCIREYAISIDLLTFDARVARFSYDVTFSTRNQDVKPSAEWKQEDSGRERKWSRQEPGRYAAISVDPSDFPDRDYVADTFRRALDACVAGAPSPAPPPKPPAPFELDAQCAGPEGRPACIVAERAAWELEHLCVVESDGVGIGGRPGRTAPRLATILAFGSDPTRILLRLAQSPNPAARAVAAQGLSKVRSPAALEALRRLAHDQEQADTMSGCVGSARPVATFAEEALESGR
jgi:hypothetical protein